MKRLILLMFFAFALEAKALERLPITPYELDNPPMEQVWQQASAATPVVQYHIDEGYIAASIPPVEVAAASAEEFRTFAQEQMSAEIQRFVTIPGLYRFYFSVISPSGNSYCYYWGGEYTVTEDDLVNGLPSQVTDFDNYKLVRYDATKTRIHVANIYRAQVVYTFPAEYGGGEQAADLPVEENIVVATQAIHDNLNVLPGITGKVVITYKDNSVEEFDLESGNKIVPEPEPVPEPELKPAVVSVTMVPASQQQPLGAAPTAVRVPRMVPEITVHPPNGSHFVIQYKDGVNGSWQLLAEFYGELKPGAVIRILDSTVSGVGARFYRALSE